MNELVNPEVARWASAMVGYEYATARKLIVSARLARYAGNHGNAAYLVGEARDARDRARAARRIARGEA